MIIKAKFIGADKSMGLEKGQVYWIDFTHAGKLWSFWRGYAIGVWVGPNWFCPYKDIVSFLNNWEVLP